MGFLHRRILIFVLSIVTHPWITLGMVLVSVVICGGAAVGWLTISTDQDELFSPKPWFFHDYLQFIHRFPENDAVYIVIEPKDPSANPPVARWAAAADHVTDRVRGLKQVVDAYCRIPVEQLGRQALLFDDPRKLPQRMAGAAGLAQLASIWGAKPSLGISLLGKNPIERSLSGAAVRPEQQTADFITPLMDSWDQVVRDPAQPISVGHGVTDFPQISAKNPSEMGYFFVPDETDRSRHRILLQVYPQRQFNSLAAVSKRIDAIRDAALDAGKDFPDFFVGVTGRPTLDADQLSTTDVDSHRAEFIALIVVFIGMATMLRSLWLALAAEISLGVGIAWTFAWATVAIGQLNLLSLVFLIALIGIGMDYLVQILSRYRLEARRYSRAGEVWIRVFKHVGPPINTACLGAAGAFLVAVFTNFRGAAELGVIAGGGLLLCLTAGYIVLPALLTIAPAKLKPFDASQRFKPAPTSHRLQWLILPLIWMGLLLIGSRFMPRTQFDPGLLKLQVPDLESVKLIRTLQTWRGVVLSKDLEQLRQVRSTVAGLSVVDSTESILDAQDNAQWLKQHASEVPKIDWGAPTLISPDDLGSIASRAHHLADAFKSFSATADSARSLADDLDHLPKSKAALVAEQLSAWQEIFVGEVRGLLDQFQPGDLDLKAIPPRLRSHLVSDDGYYALYILPRDDLWNDANLAQFETTVEKAVAAVPGSPKVTGITSDMYHTTGAIRESFIDSTIYALILIFLLVLLDFRRIVPTLLAISVLALGLPMLIALMGLSGTSWNFANFFGLPILIGAGHEYGVFMVHRYLEAEKYPRRAWRRWDVSDRALLLCGFITSTSFGFFWLLSHHQGLKSLGWVMGLGTACIYLATIMVLRPILKLRLSWGVTETSRPL